VPLIAALGAAAVCNWRWPIALRAAAIAVGVTLAVLNLPSIPTIPWQTVFGNETEQQYRHTHIPGYDAAQFLSLQALWPDAAILSVPVFNFVPQWLTHHRVLDIWENAQVVCRDASGKRAACYALDGPPLLANMDRLHVAALAIRRDEAWTAQGGALRLEGPFLRRYFHLLGYFEGTFLYLRGPGGEVVTSDLTAHTDPALLFRVRPVMGDERLALLFKDPGSATFDVTLGDHPYLEFALGRHAGHAIHEVSEMSVVVDVDGESRTVFSHFLMPADAPQNWAQFHVDLSEFAGRKVRLELRAGALVAIADPVVYATGSAGI